MLEIANIYTAKGNLKPDGGEHKSILTTGDRLSCLYYTKSSNQPEGTDRKHANLAELVMFVMEGEMEVNIGGKLAILKKGDAMLVPFNTIISSRVLSSTLAEVLVVSSPNTAPNELRLRGGPPDHSH